MENSNNSTTVRSLCDSLTYLDPSPSSIVDYSDNNDKRRNSRIEQMVQLLLWESSDKILTTVPLDKTSSTADAGTACSHTQEGTNERQKESSNDRLQSNVGKVLKRKREEDPHEKRPNESQSSSTDTVGSTSRQYHEQILENLKKENEEIKEKRRRIIFRYADLVSSYEYGLNRIAKLNDLSFAPDNVMNGNFPSLP